MAQSGFRERRVVEVRNGPLKALKVIEMAGLGPCPLAGQLLADLGADVIVVDRASGRDMSKDVNRRGKRSIALDLKQAEAVDVLLDLIGGSDVLMEGFRPGVMERLGLGPDVVFEKNPALVYGRMTGWGQEGPLAHTAGHDLNYLAITGALHAMGKDGEPPLPPLNLVADYGGGTMFLLYGIMAALFERNTSGKGQVVDAAMIDGVPAMMGMIHGMIAQGLWTKNREDNFLDGAAPYYGCYKTSDERYISVGPIEPQFFEEFIGLLKLDRALLKQQNDKRKWPEIKQLLTDTFLTRTRDEWAALFEGSDACVAPVLDFDEAAAYPHNQARNAFLRQNDTLQASPAPRFGRSDPGDPKSPVATGASGEDILREAGLEETAIARMREAGALK